MSAAASGSARRLQGEACCASLLEVYAYLDGHLSIERRTVIATHVADCDDCGASLVFHAELRRVVSHCCREEVPDSLRLRIVEAIRLQSQG